MRTPRRVAKTESWGTIAATSMKDLPMRAVFASALIATFATACTWVPIDTNGKAVRVIPAGQGAAGCEQKGEVVVSVKNKVGFYNRNPLRVQEELETLARNEAPSAGANAVQAQGQPVDGSQRFNAYLCPGR